MSMKLQWKTLALECSNYSLSFHHHNSSIRWVSSPLYRWEVEGLGPHSCLTGSLPS